MPKNVSRVAGRHFLQIPGPTPLPDRILRAMDTPIIDHRGPEFAALGCSTMRSRIARFQGELIAESFGDDVASIVVEVTDDKSLPKSERNAAKWLRQRPARQSAIAKHLAAWRPARRVQRDTGPAGHRLMPR
jgi:hypothetical protein